MDQHSLFAIAVIVIACLRYVTYFYTIYLGETKPHAFSWLIWAAVTGIGAFAQFSLNAGPAAWALAFVSGSCFFVSFLAFFIGEKNYTKTDWIALIGCFLAIPVWQATENPVYALLIIMAIDCISYWPMVRKSFYKPHTEPPISAFMSGSRYFVMLFAVSDPHWENLIYPFFLMAADWGLALYIVIRRAQLGYPLHEYARKKAI